MSRFVAFKFSLLVLFKLLNAAKYDEEPFQKFTVLFQQPDESANSVHEAVTMNLHGETFHCNVPTDDFLQSLKDSTVSNIGVFSKKISSMPCILAQDVLWMYLLCPDSDILQFSRLFPFVKQSLGTKFTDNLSREALRGFRDEGDRVFLTRRFTEGSWCDFDRKIRTDVHFYCRQDSKDVVTKVEKLSVCEYEIHVQTRFACSGVNYESEHGYPLYCRSAKHVLDVVLPNDETARKDSKGLPSSSNQYPLISGEKILSLIEHFNHKIDEPKPVNEMDEIFREALDSHVDLSIITDGLSKNKLPTIFKQYASFQFEKLVFDELKITKDEEDEQIRREISEMKLAPSMIPSEKGKRKKKKKVMIF